MRSSVKCSIIISSLISCTIIKDKTPFVHAFYGVFYLKKCFPKQKHSTPIAYKNVV